VRACLFGEGGGGEGDGWKITNGNETTKKKKKKKKKKKFFFINFFNNL
jgi:hypothetical protein